MGYKNCKMDSYQMGNQQNQSWNNKQVQPRGHRSCSTIINRECNGNKKLNQRKQEVCLLLLSAMWLAIVRLSELVKAALH